MKRKEEIFFAKGLDRQITDLPVGLFRDACWMQYRPRYGARSVVLSPQNIIGHATSLKEVTLPGLILGIAVNTAPDDYRLITSLRPQRFDGTRWVPISETIAVE